MRSTSSMSMSTRRGEIWTPRSRPSLRMLSTVPTETRKVSAAVSRGPTASSGAAFWRCTHPRISAARSRQISIPVRNREDYSAIADAMSRALAELSKSIARDLLRVKG